MFSPKSLKILPLLFMGLFSAAAAHAQTLLFHDNFTVDQNMNDVNYHYDTAGRQTGMFAPSTYTTVKDANSAYATQVGNSGGPGQLLLAANTYNVPSVTNDKNFNVAAPTLQISFTVNPDANHTAGDGLNLASWASISLGTNQKNAFVAAANPGEVGLLYRGNAGYQLFQSGTALASGTAGAGTGSFTSIRIDLTAADGVSSFDGNNALVNVFINNTLVSSFTQTGGFNGNFITFGGESDDPNQTAVHFIDDFDVTAVPEPRTGIAVAALLGGLGLMGVVRRIRGSSRKSCEKSAAV